MAEELLTLTEVARLLKVTRVTVWDWRRKGFFPRPITLPGGKPRWRRTELEKWLKSRVNGR